SLSEHSIRYIALYINTAEIARVYLHPVYSFPKVTFTIALDEGGSLRAIAEPNHSAGWESAKKIAVFPYRIKESALLLAHPHRYLGGAFVSHDQLLGHASQAFLPDPPGS